MSESEGFSALYFPYATVKNIENLKTAMLAFKHIHIIYPTEDYGGLGVDLLRNGSSPKKEDEMERNFMELHYCFDPFRSDKKENNLFKMISPVETLEKHVETIMQAFNYDMRDNSFVQKPNHEFLTWNIYAQKVPPTILHRELRIYNKGGLLRLPFPVGESIMISHAICACLEKDLMPLTDDVTHLEYLNYRIRRGIQLASEENAENNALGGFSSWDKWKQEAFQMLIPQIKSGTTVEKILLIRDQLKKELDTYRNAMMKLSTLMSNPNSMVNDIEKQINENIKPAYLVIKERCIQDSGVQIENWRYERIVPKDYLKEERLLFSQPLRMGMYRAPVGLGMMTGATPPLDFTIKAIKKACLAAFLAGTWKQGTPV
jgi:hypothetical protein